MSQRLPLPLADLLLLLAGFTLLLLAPHNVSGDASVRYQALDALMQEGVVRPMKYSHLLPLLSTPFYLLGKFLLGAQWWVSRANLFFFSIFCIFLARHFRAELGKEDLASFLLAFSLCSMLPHHLLSFHGEVLTLCLAGGGLLLLSSRLLLGSLLLALAAVNTPACLPAVALGAAIVAWERKRPWPLALPLVLGVCGILAENLLVREALLATGYAGEHGAGTLLPYSGLPGFSYPFLLGLYAILFSSGKGILFFAPGLWLLRKQAAPAPWVLFLAGLVLVYASWWAWYGGFFWGPRFFLFASLPASLALARSLGDQEAGALRDTLTLAVLLLSAWVGLSGLIFGQAGLERCTEDRYAMEHLCWFVPEFSPLARPFVAGLHWGPQRLALLGFQLLVTLRLAWPLLQRCVARVRRSRKTR